jgi:putative ABC transport system permease protein
MFFYNVRLAWKSLRRSPALSLLLLVAIALGTGVATTFSAVRHGFARDPIPEKSAGLRYVRMDSWDPHAGYPGDKPMPPPTMTYQDVTAILRSTIPVRQSPMMEARLSVHPDPATNVRPFQELTRLCFGDFFAMFNVPFRYGGPWTRAQDEKGEQVVVLGEALNEKLFGGADSTGKTVRIEDRDFRVAGVLARWAPGVKFYDLTQNPVEPVEELFMPFQMMPTMQLQTAGNTDGWKPTETPGFEGFLGSETVFLQMWVELPSAAAEADYRAFLGRVRAGSAQARALPPAARQPRHLPHRPARGVQGGAGRSLGHDDRVAALPLGLLREPRRHLARQVPRARPGDRRSPRARGEPPRRVPPAHHRRR